MDNSNAGNWLRRRWERMGFSAAGLARMGVISHATIERVARGGRVTAATARKLAGPLRLPPDVVDALSKPDVTPETLDRLAAVAKAVVLWFAVDAASLAFMLASSGRA